MVHLHSAYERINQFAIGYMINPSLHVNKVFREQVEKLLNATFIEDKMVPIKDVMKNRYTYVFALIMFYDNKGTKPIKVYTVLSFFLYSLIYNYVCIEYLSCQSKNLSRIFSNKISENQF